MEGSERHQIDDLLRGSEFLQRIFDSVLDGILVVDADGSIIYANSSAGNILGIPREELVRLKAQDIPLTMHFREGGEIPRESRPFAVALKQQGNPGPQLVLIKRPDGSTLPVLFNIGAPEGGPTVAVLSDASEMTRREKQTEDYYRLLAHDLRTPLTVILGHTDLLQSHPSNDQSSLARSLKAIRSAGEQLVAMTEEMTDRLQLESGHFSLKRKTIQPGDLIEEVVSQLTSKTTRSPIEVKSSPLPPLEIDGHRIKRVLSNLITNAMKYSPDGSRITVSAWENSRGIIIVVDDHGKGIDPEELHYIFDPFYITSVGREKEGVGLGLYIARLIVEAHGGRIYVSSTPEEGSSFAVFIPKT